ncbi:MAG TPA: hypothetical protein ENK23_04970, partial [Sorangium sp.]|nr:hypothetical protein [Sorangium sp.]
MHHRNRHSPSHRQHGRRYLRAALTAFVVGTGVAAGGAARAQDIDRDEAADAIYAEAKRLYEAGNYMRACPKFRAVHKIDPGVGSALYLGDCLEKEGKLASAMDAF